FMSACGLLRALHSFPTRRSSDLLLDWADIRRGLTITWVILAMVLMVAVLAPFVLPEQAVFSLFPPCEARLRGEATACSGRTNSADRKSTRLNSSHVEISYAVFCL